MHLTINREEANALLRALDRFLHELEFEMARVKLPRDRHPLVELDDTLHRLRDRLAAAATLDQEFVDGI
ncbi:MAG TPA: hypothetical protein VFU21_26060 [Kofleriaceae bacterium]|nr:hypothetical protein [Kofleriaceae bacterium]